MTKENFIVDAIRAIEKRGNLDGFLEDLGWLALNMWETLTDEEKWEILYYSGFTGVSIPDDYLQFATLLRPMPKDHFFAKYSWLKDSLGDQDYPYSIKYEDGTVIWTPDLEPEQKIKSTGVLWVLGGAGLCNDEYYAKNKKAEDDLIKYSGAIFWKNGEIIKQ